MYNGAKSTNLNKGYILFHLLWLPLSPPPQEKCLQETEKQFKEVSEAAGKAQRGHAALVGQVDKFRALSETHKHKSNGLETQLVALRKVGPWWAGGNHF